jgi:hypothetical protein
VTRFFAAARSPWDWDEAQFALALREYDVAMHQPHPPGFPLFVAAARIVHLFVASEFRSLQTVVVLCACLLFPLAFLLAREAGFRFRTAYHGALLFVFIPTVWFYGGTGFSDIPGVTAILAACWMLLRARNEAAGSSESFGFLGVPRVPRSSSGTTAHSPRNPEEPRGTRGTAFYLGAFLLALAAGIRPQALLFGCVPALVATFAQWKLSRKRVILGITLGAATMALIYLGAAMASHSFGKYVEQLEYVREWVRTVDAYTAPSRPPLGQLLDEFIMRPMRGGRLGVVVACLAAFAIVVSIVKRDRAVWLLLGIFVPFMTFALLMLDINSYGRYGVGYVALHALLAVRGVEALAAPLRRLRVSPAAVQAVLMLIITGRYASWTVPAIHEVRSTLSPTAAMAAWAKTLPPDAVLWVHGGMRPMLQHALPGRTMHFIHGMEHIPDDASPRNAWYISEGLSSERAAVEFRRPHNRTWEIARQRYFETYAVPLANVWRFDDGWYGEEVEGEQVTRWMRARSTTFVPADGQRSRLTLKVVSPSEIKPTQIVEVRWNGVVIDRFPSPGDLVTWSKEVDTKVGTNVLELRVSGIATLATDRREFGVRLFEYSLRPL